MDGFDRSPSRRRLLALAGAAASTALAGCTADVGEEFPPNTKTPVSAWLPDLPVTKPTDVVADGIEATADREIVDEDDLAAVLEARDLEIHTIERTADVLTVEYVSGELYEEGILHGIGPIAGAYAALVGAGEDSEFLEITILDTAPESFGTAEVEAAWAERFDRGTYSVDEYAELVVAGIESRRHPPEVGASTE
ncbi:hypothetical protein [Saliphagus infecundisoli]|uniref:DUF8159 domain-containing protein n=1 Tax=Saliphagus infecundisoli TaxID=1849069 RepID=A0ABD5QFD6_9EURY|nr:hypothetical protein [Saliphagus infecundisoli]